MGDVHAVVGSPVGELTLVGDGERLAAVWMSGGRRRTPATALGVRDGRAFAAAREQLAEYFAGERTEFGLELAPRGSRFELSVWAALAEIPYGRTVSYGELARRVGRPGAARAVGIANARNPLPIVVPCHRVIGADGSLTGYSGGLDAKRWLLELEAARARPRLIA